MSVLGRLYDELLACIVKGVPLPNPTVYRTAWLRDAAMVGIVLEQTGELERIRDWVLHLADPYDRNNAGHEEPDNLGQALVLISMVADERHPLVPSILEEAKRRLDPDGALTGLTDFGRHPVYATKWLQWGLSRLDLSLDVRVPAVADPYSSLFWMAYKDQHVASPAPFEPGNRDYPYLQWAHAHFHGDPPPLDLLGCEGGLTWEANASQADYSSVAPHRRCVPHAWHAAEAWLYLAELGSPD